MNSFSTNKFSSWIDLQSGIAKFDMNAEYRIILKDQSDYDEDKYTTIYMNSCSEYELYFNDSIDEHVYGRINVDDLSNYSHVLKGQRDRRINSTKYKVYKVQMSNKNKNKWTKFNEKYFNVKNDYRLIIDEEDSNLDTKLSKLMVTGYVRQNGHVENKGFSVIAGIIQQYYNNCGNRGYINMEQVVKRELYFTPSVANHYYGCVKSSNSGTWHYRFQGNCIKKVDDKNYQCHRVECRQQDDDNKYETLKDDENEFNINYQYRVRLIKNGGYIVVERVTKDALYFGVSISLFWAGCVRINNKHSWHYVDRATNKFEKVGKGNYSVYSVEYKK